PLRLRPQLGDVAQVFGIYASLLEEPPRCLHLSQALLRLMLPALLLHEPFVAPDRPKRLLRERQTEVALHALSAPGRELALERDGPPALPRRDAAARVDGCAASIFKSAQRARLPTSEPLAHRLDGRGELPGCGLNAVLAGVPDQLKAQVRRLCGSAQHGVVSERTHRTG